MGVIRNFDQVNRSAIDEEWLIISSDGEEAVQNVGDNLSSNVGIRRRNQRQPKKNVATPEPTFSAKGVKGKSHHKVRRFTNANLAMTELGSLVDESELEAISINDFIPQNASPFALLMQNFDQAVDLNSFLNCTEDQQREILGHDIQLEHYSQESQLDTFEDSDSSECFFRIDPKLRKQMLKKRIPLGILSSIEAKIVQFFKDNPKSLYKEHFQCSFHRLLLHACCQYLNLNCRSVDDGGYRLSLVKNKSQNFSCPIQLLSEYLEVIL